MAPARGYPFPSAAAQKRPARESACASAAPKLVLVEGLKGGRPGLHVLPLLATRDEQGELTDEMRRIYGEDTSQG